MDNYWLNRRIKVDKDKEKKDVEDAQAIWNHVQNKRDKKKLLTRYKKK
jgi:hypothetical protein